MMLSHGLALASSLAMAWLHVFWVFTATFTLSGAYPASNFTPQVTTKKTKNKKQTKTTSVKISSVE